MRGESLERGESLVRGESLERLFVAVEVGSDARTELDAALAPLRAAYPRLAWVRPERWHLTLAFVGEVSGEVARFVDEAAAAAATGHTPMSLRLDGVLGVFGRGVLWAGLAPAPGLDDLAGDVRAELAARDVPFDDKPFRAHLTVARARRGDRVPRRVTEEFAGPEAAWRVDRVVVVRSERGAHGLRYVPRTVAPLAGG